MSLDESILDDTHTENGPLYFVALLRQFFHGFFSFALLGFSIVDLLQRASY